MPHRKSYLASLPLQPSCWSWSMPQNHTSYDVDGMFTWHECRCAVCANGPGLVIDHDHQTGFIRGLLCTSCNIAEPKHDGVFELYRKISPAYLFDIEVKWSTDHNWIYRQWRAA